MNINRKAIASAHDLDGAPKAVDRFTSSATFGHDASPADRMIEAHYKSAESRTRNKAERESRLQLRRF